jgi:hypothetical protein
MLSLSLFDPEAEEKRHVKLSLQWKTFSFFRSLLVVAEPDSLSLSFSFFLSCFQMMGSES